MRGVIRRTVSLTALLFFLLISRFGTGLMAGEGCRTFRACHEKGKVARQEKNFPLSLNYFSKACAMEVKPSLMALKFSSCNQVIDFSKTVDNYVTARSMFEDLCAKNVDNGCFFLGKLEEEQGNLARAMEIMEPLCESGFRHNRISGYGGCDALKIMKLKWKSLHPDPPKKSRTGPLQIGAFFALFVFILISLILMGIYFTKKNQGAAWWSLVCSLFGFGVYVFYESGVSPYASIRVDLLLIFPALLLNLILTVLVFFQLRKRRKLQP